MIDLGVYSVHGACVQLRVSRSLAGYLEPALADLARANSASPTHRIEVRHRFGLGWTVDAAWGDRYRGREAHLALYDTLTALNELAAHQAVLQGCVVLHGGAIAIDGRGVAFVGHSGAGKSTLTAAMALAGCRYLADEVVAVDDDHRARPFHRPVGLRREGAAVAGEVVPPGPFDTTYPLVVGRRAELSDAVPLGLVLVLNRDETTSAAVHQLRPALALFTLTNETLGGQGLEPEMFSRLDRLVRGVPVGRLDYSSVEGLEDDIARALDGAASWSL